MVRECKIEFHDGSVTITERTAATRQHVFTPSEKDDIGAEFKPVVRKPPLMIALQKGLKRRVIGGGEPSSATTGGEASSAATGGGGPFGGMTIIFGPVTFGSGGPSARIVVEKGE